MTIHQIADRCVSALLMGMAITVFFNMMMFSDDYHNEITVNEVVSCDKSSGKCYINGTRNESETDMFITKSISKPRIDEVYYERCAPILVFDPCFTEIVPYLSNRYSRSYDEDKR